MRVIFALAMVVLALVLPSLAQTDEAPWQAVVTGQIEAFRAGDGDAALSFAGAGFQTQFDGKPDAFIASRRQAMRRSWSHGPIVSAPSTR